MRRGLDFGPVARALAFASVARAVSRRPRLTLAVVAVLALGGAALALRLEPSVDTDTLVDRGSDTFAATEAFKRDFGDDSVVIMAQGSLQKLVLTANLGRLIRLEGCLSGNVPPEGLRSLPRVCSALAETKPARVVFGPGTFLNLAATQISGELQKRVRSNARRADLLARQAAQASKRRGDPRATQEGLAADARRLAQTQLQQQLLGLGLRYGLLSVPRVDNPDFVSRVVFDPSARSERPKSRFAYLFPSPNAALIQVRLKPELSDGQRSEAIERIRQATGEKVFKAKIDRGERPEFRYVVTGVPVVAQGLASAVQSAIVVLLIAALLVMAATLALVFRTRLRLLPLVLALAAAAMTFGVLALVGGSLTMASIAVLPVLIGLAVDYAIQFQARFDEARARPRRGGGPEAAAEHAAVAGGPTIATAGLATVVGFLVLLVSPVPMVRGFGALLVLGIVLALACAITAGFAALVIREADERPEVPPVLPRLRAALRRLGRRISTSRVALAALRRGDTARDRIADRAERALAYSMARPRKVLGIGLIVAIVGLAADTQSEVTSDIQELVPQDLQALRDVSALQAETGIAGEIDVTVRAADVTDPAVLGWMGRFQDKVLKEAGFERAGRDSCLDGRHPPDLCPAFSLTDLFQAGAPPQSRQVSQLLDAVPTYFQQGAVTRDRKTANLAFGIRLQPLDRQRDVVDKIKDELDPPPGVDAQVVGLPVLAAEANGQLSSPLRRLFTLVAALLAVFGVLWAVRRSRQAAFVPMIPIALATGWSAGVLFVLGLLPGPLEVDLNPMSVTLGALVIAIATEFSVLLSARYAQERERGAGPERALALTYGSTGAAVLASGTTAIAGFAVLILSDITMLRDFGIVTVVDLSVSLVGVMLVLPAALLWAEEHGPITLRDLDPRRLARELWESRPRGRLPRPPRRSLRAPRFGRRRGSRA
ncbi:MAG: MMPL family transporter [Actinomycetota bacterium]|nr:MMPL family transporter [Actinomycetota bacterium]